MINAGLVAEGTVLFNEYKDTRYEALVQADGTILFEGATYKSPSAAGRAVTAKHDVSAPNGWQFWQITDSADATRLLETVRQEYISQQSPEQKR